jgi:hypothetical protein
MKFFEFRLNFRPEMGVTRRRFSETFFVLVP